MNEHDLLALARSEALKTTTTPEQYLRAVRTAHDPTTYISNSHWRKAMQALEQLKHLPAPAPPAGDAYLNVVRNLLVFATVTDDAIQHACRLGPEWKFLFTADPAYPVSDQQIAAARASGHGVYAWGDCMTTLPPAIMAFARARRMDGWYGQAETPEQFNTADQYLSYKGMIANLSALTNEQLGLVASGNVLVTAEFYKNVQPNMQPDWRGANKGVGGNCGAVYESASEGAVYTPVTAYHGACNSWYVEGFREEDWKLRGA